MKTETIVCCVVALLLGMLLANMLKSVCGCKTVEGNGACVAKKPLRRWKLQCPRYHTEEKCGGQGPAADPGWVKAGFNGGCNWDPNQDLDPGWDSGEPGLYVEATATSGSTWENGVRVTGGH